MTWTSSADVENTGEHKVPLRHLLNDFHLAGWRDLTTTHVWPVAASEHGGGCFLLEFQAPSEGVG